MPEKPTSPMPAVSLMEQHRDDSWDGIWVAKGLYESWKGYMNLVGGVEPLKPQGYF